MKSPLLQRLTEVAALFLKLGMTAFGGPAAHIAMMHDETVKRRQWLSDQEFLDLVGATNLIPGPNSTEMAIHIGYLRAGWRECSFAWIDGRRNLAIGPGFPDQSTSYFHCSCFFRVVDLVQSQFDMVNRRRRANRVVEHSVAMKFCDVNGCNYCGLLNSKPWIACHCMPPPRNYDLTIKLTPRFFPFVTA